MNLYRVNFKRLHKKSWMQEDEGSYVVMAENSNHAEKVVQKRIEFVQIKNSSRIQEGAHLVNETFLIDNFS